MTKTKSTKRALLTSALALLLCVSMLIGSTFAWFTDSVTSAGNIIKSGKLDVTMEWKDATATGKQLTYKDASEGAIFNYELWEPGYVEAKNIKISNVGTLALKYHLNIAANGEVSDLADVIDVYFAEGEYTLANRDMAELTLVGTLSDILDGMPANMAGDLEADTADTVTIALKMQESAGNKYQDLAIGTDFKVILMATQDNVEFDSFDENYDDIEVPDKDIKVIDGNTYYYLEDGNVVLRSVPYGNVGSTFNFRDDITILGIGTDKGDTNGPVFSKSSPIESITLNEGLTAINARAITGIKTLKSINFPSTLKFIGEQAFAQAGMTELTIPSNVEEIKFGAFRDMANLTTVTIEGNPTLANYVFRSCPNLTSIYLLGDDVQFEGGGQFATHQDTGYSNPLTIYVKNATVAARVYAAQSSATDYEVKILGDAADGSDATAVEQVKNNTQLDEAIKNGASTVVLGSGTYSTPASAKGKTLTIIGNGDTVVDVLDYGAAEGDGDYSLEGSTVTFENVTITTKTTYFPGYVRMKGIYNNCTINGVWTLYDNGEFNNCTFNVSGDVYNVWTWGAAKATFNNCTFNNDGKAILVYGGGSTKLTVNGCTFNDNGGLTSKKAAIEVGAGYGSSFDLNISDTVVNGYEINDEGINTGTTLWGNKNSMGTDKLNVVVDGVDVY
ncbi:MAG: leucine-rich repeat protein [Clostridia bacterium]|nr:leucine-rich repeat protein [Clostridia bacterium]